MNKLIMMLSLSLFSFTLAAQGQKADYNIKGDDAMSILDFSEAKVWYQIGVEDQRCDKYSISKLTEIWKVDESMRASMRNVMDRCLKCLNDFSTLNRDTTSIKLLVEYYSEGIGTNKNEDRAKSWQSQLNSIRLSNQAQLRRTGSVAPREKVKMEFFVGYAATLEAPFGLTIGGVGRTVGWYLRFRTNMSFQRANNTFELDSYGEPSIIGGLDDGLPDFSGKEEVDSKVNFYTGTGGLMFKITPSFYLSIGGGYCVREYLLEYQKIGIIEADYDPSGPFWAKSNYLGDSSFSGAAVDIDGTFKIGKSFYGSIGCTIFDFKYISANAGIGVFF